VTIFCCLCCFVVYVNVQIHAFTLSTDYFIVCDENAGVNTD
jgi:hypothetical protein